MAERVRRRAALRGLAVALVLGFSLDAGAVDLWVGDGSGQCVKSWSPASLVRGPRAMLGALLLPFRSLAGGFTGGVAAAVLSPFSLVVGLAEAGSWFIAGALDTATAGSLGLAPTGATQLTLRPLKQLPPGDRHLEEYAEVIDCDEAKAP